jgi:hypothetical protein
LAFCCPKMNSGKASSTKKSCLRIVVILSVEN